jgi:asparagine synthase (glutamine-hydrolysing)
MCGISGFWSNSRDRPAAPLQRVARDMAAAIAHRGPDSEGVWADPDAGIALGHRRLAIVDLSPHGHQPMSSPSGRYVVVFNGEIYNFRQLRAELAGRFAFHGTSDTEVMLAAVEAWGLGPALGRFVGMFAFALWDRSEQTLHLVRDRLGKKPLYYGMAGNALLFASELHALRRHPGFAGEIDRSSIALLLRYNCIPAPHSIYQGIRKLPPGCTLSIRSPLSGELPPPVPYWSAHDVAADGLRHPARYGDAEAADALEELLTDAVGLRMVADVPLGAFLSGGVDSSLVVALMQRQSSRPVRTFSIGSSDSDYNEAEHAAAVARHLGTDHTELYVSAEDGLAVIPRLASIYDEPFADSSQVPTYLVSALARREVTVTLSGDGGDELFAGYNRHLWGERVWRTLRFAPAPVRWAAARALSHMSARRWDAAYAAVEPMVPRSLRQQMFGYKVHKLAGLVESRSPAELYSRAASHWLRADDVVIGARSAAITPLADEAGWDFTAKMMYWDLVSYLPDDILTKIDRASMAVALEARTPLLDHRVVEFAWKLPFEMKVRKGQSKWLLRQVLYRHVPRDLIERPKSGFGIPLDSWLRGPLRDWAEALLDERRLRHEGYFHPGIIRERWQQHLSGRSSWQYHLWDVLMFQAWHEAQLQGPAPASTASSAEAFGTLPGHG